MELCRKYKSELIIYLPGLVSGKYTLQQASVATGYSVCWLSQLKQRYKKIGFDCLVHGNKNHVSPAKTKEEKINKILLLYASKYSGLNFLYFKELLEEEENIKISYTTLRKIMNSAGIKSPEAHREKKRAKVHRPRIRRKNEGDLIQLDGTPYQWFNRFGDENYYDIMASVDDATSKITGMYMCKNECLYGYNEVMRQTLTKYGRPVEAYTDRAAIFCCTTKKKQNLTVWEQLQGVHNKVTQWQRILDDLHIHQILAWSPQAKGRVERMWSTVQKRLPFWLYQHGIKTVEEANRRLPEFIEYYNRKFGVKSKKQETFWRPINCQLDDVLCARIKRHTDSNGCFSFHAYKFAIIGCSRCASKDIEVCISERGFQVCVDDKYYNVRFYDDNDYVTDIVADNLPQAVKDIMYRYLYEDQKEVSA